MFRNAYSSALFVSLLYRRPMQPIAAKLWQSLTTMPGRRGVAGLVLELIWLAPVMGICVVLSDTMQWAPAFDDATLRLALVAIIVPSLGEELLFRAALLPQPQSGQSIPIMWSAAGIGLFVAWHPLQALFTTDARATIFLDPWFLVAVAALGLACTRAYWRSGSIWSAVILHWLVVVGWKALAGGPALI